MNGNANDGAAQRLSQVMKELGLGMAGAGQDARCAIRVALTDSREFGPVISAGLGGEDAALALDNFRKDRAAVHASAMLTDADDFLALFRRTVAYQRLASRAARLGAKVPDEALRDLFARVLSLASNMAAKGLGSLVLDPVVIDGAAMVLDGWAEAALSKAVRQPRPIRKIGSLIHPKRIGIVGVSSSGMNFGRIILKNLVGSGYPKDKLVIIRPGEAEIDGVACVESLAALDGRLDLLVMAVPSGAVYALVDEVIASAKVDSVMLIPGGLGETKASVEPAAAMAARINAAHGNPDGGPVFLGANCLGVVSHPGGYDSWFIPLERLPKPKKKAVHDSVMLSQSGAFMITRISRNPWLDPAYMLALGNQTDLTHGDLLTYFAGQDEIHSLGIYVEGFKDGDGLDFIKAVRKAVLAGKEVVVYKSGRSEAGQKGVMGHTASIAGDPVLFEAVVRHAGAMVAEDVDVFDDLFYLASALKGKRIGGSRLGAISGAGFEAVGMVDAAVTEGHALTPGDLTDASIARIRDILVAKKLDALVEIRNPLDINPGADDEAHLDITKAFLDDPGIDAVMVGWDPASPAIAALASSKLRPGFDITHAVSAVQVLPPVVDASDKPVIAVVDGGPLYDAMADALMDKGVCVFRNCMRAARALTRYTESRLHAEALRKRG